MVKPKIFLGPGLEVYWLWGGYVPDADARKCSFFELGLSVVAPDGKDGHELKIKKIGPSFSNASPTKTYIFG